MFVKMGYKKWSGGSQVGLRVYTDAILRLEPLLVDPSRDGAWDALSDFLAAVRRESGATSPYSRDLQIVRQGRPGIAATLTIARHGRTTQGYITAPIGSWLREYALQQLGRDEDLEYLVQPSRDLLVIPGSFGKGGLEAREEQDRIDREVKKYCKKKKYSPPPDARRIGLYFEILEVNYLRKAGLAPQHRYPSITSRIAKLRRHGISCDIDVFNKRHRFVKYVEVKAVAGAVGSDFALTPREFDSREKCRTNSWSYDIVVYYHFGKQVVQRVVMDIDCDLDSRPSGYWCSPRWKD